MPLRDQMRKGSSEIIVFSLLAEESMYGYQMTRELKRRSGGYFHMKEGLLYPTLHRMEQEGLIASEWRAGTGSRRRKYYHITDKGRQALRAQTAAWRTFTERLLHLLDTPVGAAGTP